MTGPWNADQLFSSNSVEWETPRWVMDLIREEFDLGLDVCASPQNAQCDRFLTEKDDAIQEEWGGLAQGSAVWMNPPWGRGIGRFVERAREQASKHGLIVVCLLPSSTDTRWWCDHVMRSTQVRFIRGRLHFIREDGHTGPCTKGSAVVVFTAWGQGPPTFSVVEKPTPPNKND